ncbi:hypothetical protein D3C85_1487170 [compost metagenome]
MAALTVGEQCAERAVVHFTQAFIPGFAGSKIPKVGDHQAGAQRAFELQADKIRAVEIFQFGHMVAKRKLRHHFVVKGQIGVVIGLYRLVTERGQRFIVSRVSLFHGVDP